MAGDPQKNTLTRPFFSRARSSNTCKDRNGRKDHYSVPTQVNIANGIEGSKNKVLCCAAGSRNICVGFADVARIRRESGAYFTQVVTRKICVRCASCSPRIVQMLREERATRSRNKCCERSAQQGRATRDVTFGPLYISVVSQ
jgi:hypothetical protein